MWEKKQTKGKLPPNPTEMLVTQAFISAVCLLMWLAHALEQPSLQ